MAPDRICPTDPVEVENQWAAHGKDREKTGQRTGDVGRPFAALRERLPSVAVDLLDDNWFEAVGSLDLLVCCNVLHVSPWACSEALFEGAGEVLRPGGQLLIYGPFKVNGDFVGDDDGAGNRKFDAKLRENSVEWGLRDVKVDDLNRLASYAGLEPKKRVEMPANNLLQFVKVRTGLLGRIAEVSVRSLRLCKCDCDTAESTRARGTSVERRTLRGV